MPKRKGAKQKYSATFLARGIAILRAKLERLLRCAADLKFDFLKNQVKDATEWLKDLWECATERQVLEHPVILQALMSLESDLEILRLVVASRAGFFGRLRF